MNPPAFHNGGGFCLGFLFGTNRGLRPDPGPGVMLLNDFLAVIAKSGVAK